VFTAILVLSVEIRFICPSLDPLSMLEVVLPLAFVNCPVHVLVKTMAVGLVVHPISFIDVTIYMHKLSFPISFILSPLSDV
jgi:hypothetical protein